ncbi:hypothetical protein HELRODRAFT_193617 [Helobdella robusta]|uniref:Peptidase M3A/M3B catalytic domain-containing protein n=1 Tax=Helobdella robusta TaxID=6412 RepID=T1FV67_HELRO|nr:hypothetical protein HELRODRAFT_193617 [Helobdella robusta]ESN95279.1 hypothetical protein HELRODRAFT_193617 [Helobdella robusta]
MANLFVKSDFSKLETLCKFYQNICKKFASSKKSAVGYNSYYVLLPEIPPDTKETNPILRVNEFPKFSEITPDKCVTGCAKRSIEFDVEIGNFLDTIKQNRHLLTFEKIFHPLEEQVIPLNYAWRTTKHLSYVQSNTSYRDAFKRIHYQIENAKNQRWLSPDLYLSIKELNAGHRLSLDVHQRRLVDMYLLQSRLNGIELTGDEKKKFINHLIKLAELKNHFRNRVMMCTNMFYHDIEDFSIVSELPKSFLSHISTNKLDPTRGPWRVTLNQTIYNTMMSYCGDRMTRWNLWNAYNNRASRNHDDKNLSNHIIIEEIRLLSLKQRFQPIAEDEVTQLQEFANSEGFPFKLEMWDVPYWRRRQLDHMYPVNTDGLKDYFPLKRVFEYLFGFCKVLFGIQFIDCTGTVETWHEDVKFYRLYDNESGKELGAFYLDAFTRPSEKMGGVWMESGRERSQFLNLFPFSYFCLNLDRPEQGKPCLVTYEQLQQIFFQFGHGLQQLATTTPYGEISGQRNIEWDALATCANLMKMILNTRQTLRSMSRHYETGKSLPDDVVDSIMKRRHHLSSFDNMMNLYTSAFDLELYINKDRWHPVMQKMLACDIFKTFRNASREGTHKMIEVGTRYRNTFLSMGGGLPSSEVFRRFQGQDPSPESLVSYYLHR